LTSCSGPVLHQQFRSFNSAYASTLNEQLLLNLARLENGHPAYYLAVGPINNKFSFGAEASGGGSSTLTDSQTHGTTESASGGVLGLVSRTVSTVGSTVNGATYGGKLSGTASPDFQFIPLNNEIVARQILEPISTDVFFTLYQQGYPIDQLFRMLIERIETTLPSGGELVLINSPTQGEPEVFARFLRTCAILREMQRAGTLVLETRQEFEAFADAIFGGPGEKFAPTPDQLIKADDQKVTWRLGTNGSWQVGRNRAVPTFFLRTDRGAKVERQLIAAGVTTDTMAISNVVQLLTSGVTVKTRPESSGQARTRLVLRSFARVMESVAVEQAGFDTLMSRPDFHSTVPKSQQRPILRTVWKKTDPAPGPALLTLAYAGRNYRIADEDLPPLDSAGRWNRDVFRMLAALSSQVTVDISKFQRQVLELR